MPINSTLHSGIYLIQLNLKNDGFGCAYKDGMITIVLNPALKPYFIELAHDSIYELKHYMHSPGAQQIRNKWGKYFGVSLTQGSYQK